MRNDNLTWTSIGEVLGRSGKRCSERYRKIAKHEDFNRTESKLNTSFSEYADGMKLILDAHSKVKVEVDEQGNPSTTTTTSTSDKMDIVHALLDGATDNKDISSSINIVTTSSILRETETKDIVSI